LPLRNPYCEDRGSTPGTYESGKVLNLSFSCKALPRPLKIGDKIKVMDFVDQSGKDWLIFDFPIEGYQLIK
jgi:hypothetical protein